MKYAIDTLTLVLAATEAKLQSMKDANARQLGQAEEFEAKIEHHPELREQYANAAKGLRDSVTWYEENAIPKEGRKIAELEDALKVLRGHSAGVAGTAEHCERVGAETRPGQWY